jgi:hypothetical protein
MRQSSDRIFPIAMFGSHGARRHAIVTALHFDWVMLVALAAVNFVLADARDGLGPFLDGFLATHCWSPMTPGFIATLGGIRGMMATPLFGAWGRYLSSC